jgi:hypothetical protein
MLCEKLYVDPNFFKRHLYISVNMKGIMFEAKCTFLNIVYVSIFHVSMKMFSLMQHMRFLCVHNVCTSINN